MLSQPQLSKPVQYHSANTPYFLIIKIFCLCSFIFLFLIYRTTIIVPCVALFSVPITTVRREREYSRHIYFNFVFVISASLQFEPPEPFTVDCFQDSFLDQPDSLLYKVPVMYNRYYSPYLIKKLLLIALKDKNDSGFLLLITIPSAFTFLFNSDCLSAFISNSSMSSLKV